MEKILEKIGLGTLVGRFQEERIEPEIVLALTDGELTHLGISTMGDRICLRRTCRVSTSMQISEESNLSVDNIQSSSDSSVRPASGLTGERVDLQVMAHH